MLISQNLSFRSRLLVNDIPQPPQSLVVLFNFNFDLQLYNGFFKVEPCGALCFTVVASHLEPTLLHFCETLKCSRLCFMCRSPLRPSPLCGNFRFVFAQCAARLRGLHMCVLDLSHLPVVGACPLWEVLSISLIAICDCTTLSHLVCVERRMSLVIR